MCKYCCLLLVLLCLPLSLPAAEPAEALMVREVLYVPLRAVADWLHAPVSAEQKTGAVTLTLPAQTTQVDGRTYTWLATTLRVVPHSLDAQLNGRPIQFTRPALKRKGALYVPANGIVTPLGMEKQWEAPTKILTLTHPRAADPLVFRTCMLNLLDGATMVWVPAGEFVMGTSGTKRLTPAPGAKPGDPIPVQETVNYKERPAHTVYLDGYWLYQYEVTVEQYRYFCQQTGRAMPPPPVIDSANDIRAWREGYPISNVTWEDAVAYAAWAGGRLPTEAEWEKAARGPDGREYPWGTRFNAACVNGLQHVPGEDRSRPVGSFPAGASPYGAYDLAGNVAEWCRDGYGSYLTAAWAQPSTPADTKAVVRGGSWYDADAERYRAAYRWTALRTDRAATLGFRVVLPSSATRPPRIATRKAIAVGQTDLPPQSYAKHLPADYRCAGAWQADLDSDGVAETVLIGTAQPGKTVPPLLVILQHDAPVARYLFEDQHDRTLRWQQVVGDTGKNEHVPLASFGVRDLNADGRLEIYLLLASAPAGVHDEQLTLFTWQGTDKLTRVAAITLTQVEKPTWQLDEWSRAYPGLEIKTTMPPAASPERVDYYGWNGQTYIKYNADTNTPPPPPAS